MYAKVKRAGELVGGLLVDYFCDDGTKNTPSGGPYIGYRSRICKPMGNFPGVVDEHTSSEHHL